MNKHTVAISSNGHEVYAYLMQAPLSVNISRNPHLLSLVKEAISTMKLTQESILLEHDMGRDIGYSDLLETREKDTIFYARTHRSEAYTRFVKHRKNNHTSILTIKLQRDEAGSYELVNTWIGKTYPALPGTSEATEQSKPYWETHAVVFNGQSLISNTITKDCPY